MGKEITVIYLFINFMIFFLLFTYSLHPELKGLLEMKKILDELKIFFSINIFNVVVEDLQQ